MKKRTTSKVAHNNLMEGPTGFEPVLGELQSIPLNLILYKKRIKSRYFAITQNDYFI